jgi:large subunit ribosomal protein L22
MAKTETTAKLNNLHIAPRKVRLVANLIRGMQVDDALAQLLVVTARSADPITKLLRSAISNAKNSGMNTDKLIVKTVFVDQGPMLKRSLPRAQGRATPIMKKMSHVTLVLAESSTLKPSRFDLSKADKKVKKDVKPERHAKVKTSEAKSKEIKEDRKPGFFRRTFQRKAI